MKKTLKILVFMALMAVVNTQIAFAQEQKNLIPTNPALRIQFAETVTPIFDSVEGANIGEINIEFLVERTLDKGKTIVVVENITVLILNYDEDSVDTYPIQEGMQMTVTLLTQNDRQRIIKNYGQNYWDAIKKRKDQVFIWTGKKYFKLNPQLLDLATKKKK